jgi:D-galactarolactone cycloisomerase
MLEYDCNPNPLRDELLTERLPLDNHMVRIPQGPGLGIGIDSHVLKHFSADHRKSSIASVSSGQ